jgi:hypothetical protein
MEKVVPEEKAGGEQGETVLGLRIPRQSNQQLPPNQPEEWVIRNRRTIRMAVSSAIEQKCGATSPRL